MNVSKHKCDGLKIGIQLIVGHTIMTQSAESQDQSSQLWKDAREQIGMFVKVAVMVAQARNVMMPMRLAIKYLKVIVDGEPVIKDNRYQLRVVLELIQVTGQIYRVQLCHGYVVVRVRMVKRAGVYHLIAINDTRSMFAQFVHAKFSKLVINDQLDNVKEDADVMVALLTVHDV
ncbi:Hypothetical protein MVR_LOCUS333 [uncultured virus]|nr:Hypothetical protein MVR_LOCUS333 [uncultured virus]